MEFQSPTFPDWGLSRRLSLVSYLLPRIENWLTAVSGTIVTVQPRSAFEELSKRMTND